MFVDQAPPNDSGSLNAPTPPPVPSQKLSAREAAKLALWSPFVGLFVLISLVAIAGARNDDGPHPVIASVVTAICWLIWIAGLVLGIKALQRGKTEGHKGVLGRAFVGITLNILFLGLTIWAAVFAASMIAETTRLRDKAAADEAAAVRARAGDGEALQLQSATNATSAFVANALELQKKYEKAGAALTNPPVLDMALVKGKEDLQTREVVVQEFIAASKELLDFSNNSTEAYRQELLNHKLTPEIREACLKAFIQKVQGVNPTLIALRRADVRRGEATLNVLTYLEDNWGQWEYRPETKRLRFKDTKLLEGYNPGQSGAQGRVRRDSAFAGGSKKAEKLDRSALC